MWVSNNLERAFFKQSVLQVGSDKPLAPITKRLVVRRYCHFWTTRFQLNYVSWFELRIHFTSYFLVRVYDVEFGSTKTLDVANARLAQLTHRWNIRSNPLSGKPAVSDRHAGSDVAAFSLLSSQSYLRAPYFPKRRAILSYRLFHRKLRARHSSDRKGKRIDPDTGIPYRDAFSL
jgi:hypothetical protein